MFWRVVHDTLKWLWPALFTGVVATVTIAVAAAQVWPGAKAEVGRLFTRALAMLSSPWTWLAIVVIFVAWLAAFIWSGIKVRETGARPDVRRELVPLHRALQYVARDSKWAEDYVGDDTDWVVALTKAFQRALSLGEIAAFAYRQLHHRVLEDGITKLDPAFWISATMDLSHLAAFHPPKRAHNDGMKYDFIEVDMHEVRRAFPPRSKAATISGRSPIERIGNYDMLWSEQETNYTKALADARLTPGQRFYQDEPETV